MKALRKGASGGITKFILFGFLILAVGGLVMMDVGGFFRGGVANSDVAKAGNQRIPIAAFDRTVRMTLGRIGMEPKQAYQVGYIDQILNGEIRSRLLSQAAEDLDIVVGKPRIAKQISDLVAPMTQPGQNPADVLKQILMSQGMSEGAFVTNMGRDMANGLLANALEGGLQTGSADMAKDLYRFQNESRTIEYVTFLDSEVSDLTPPEEKQIQSLYDATKEAYSKPELRTLKIIIVKNDSLKKTLEISDETVRGSYDSNIDLYTVAANRTLDQALIDSEDQAKKVYEAAKAGKSLKTAVTAAGASPASYIGEQDFEDGSLVEQTKAQVLAAKNPGEVIGPVSTPLGWYVIVVKKISPAKTKSYDEVKAEIRDELMENQLVDQYYELANGVDDLFAGGASLEDVQKEIDVDVKTLAPMNQFGQDKEGKDALKDYEAVRTNITETAFELSEGETSAVFESPDGKFMAVSVDSITPKTYTPFEEVKDGISKRWMNDQRRVSNQVKAMQILSESSAGKSLKELAQANNKQIQTMSGISGAGEPKAPLTLNALGKIFEAEMGVPVVIDIEGGLAVARTTDFKWPETINEKSEDFTTLVANLKKATHDEGMALYLDAKRQKYGASINKPLLDQVYGPEATPN